MDLVAKARSFPIGNPTGGRLQNGSTDLIKEFPYLNIPHTKRGGASGT